MRFLRVTFVLAFALLICLVPVALFAQATTSSPVAPPDWGALAVTAIGALAGVIAVLVTWGMRLAMATAIPKWIWPLVAMLLGFGLTYLTNLLGAGHLSALQAALVGVAVPIVRDIIALINANGLGGTTTPGATIRLF